MHEGIEETLTLALKVVLGSIHIIPEGFENRCFTLKTLQMFSSTLRQRNLEMDIVFEKFCFQNACSPTQKWKADIFKFLKL